MSTLAEQLADALNGVNNAAASTVSAPVDAISWGLRKAGLGNVIGQAPVGGSDWMRAKGLTRPTNGLAGDVGEFAGNVLPIAAAAKAPQIANGLLKMGENALAPSTLGSQRGAIVYHGSPHAFDAFDMSKIGTGEGAQAYGHGLYFAESPDVANYYQKTGINATPSIRKNGARVEDELLSSARPGDNVFAAQINSDLPRGRVLSDADLSKVKESLAHHADLYAGSPRAAYYEDALNRFDELKAKVIGGKFDYEPGHLYKVDLPDEAIAKMLDWDKPLSQQSPEVQAALAKSDVRYGPLRKNARIADPAYNGPMTGGDVYNDITRALVPEGAQDIWRGATPISGQGTLAAQHLRELGIPGIRYLDGGSRGAGDGTRNYVVFDDKLPKIFERNGKSISEQFAEKWK